MPLKKPTLYCAGSTAAAGYAAGFLEQAGVALFKEPCRSPDCLLLDVPSFQSNGLLRDGQDPADLLDRLPKSITVIGGKLTHPALEGYSKIDLLTDEFYLAENAAITAECALDVALPYLTVTLRNCPVLILGWGRIGKCLARLLRRLDARVCVAARKGSDLALLRALGYDAVDCGELSSLATYRLIFNTVPAPVLQRDKLETCRPDCVKIDLASYPGMDGEDVIIARGLPGVHFPESSGRLIAETILRKEHLL